MKPLRDLLGLNYSLDKLLHMKKPLTHALLLAAAIFCFSAAESVRAQSSPKCEIKKITPELFRSPDKGYKKAAPGQPPQWLEIDVEFDMQQDDKKGPKFGEELIVNYYILLDNKQYAVDKKQTLLTGSVTHMDIRFDKGLHVGAFVSPQTLLMLLGDKTPANANQAITNIGVTISDATGVIARLPWKGESVWWENTEQYTEITGRVLAKDNTPFAHLSWDYYLPTKPKSGL